MNSKNQNKRRRDEFEALESELKSFVPQGPRSDLKARIREAAAEIEAAPMIHRMVVFGMVDRLRCRARCRWIWHCPPRSAKTGFHRR